MYIYIDTNMYIHVYVHQTIPHDYRHWSSSADLLPTFACNARNISSCGLQAIVQCGLPKLLQTIPNSLLLPFMTRMTRTSKRQPAISNKSEQQFPGAQTPQERQFDYDGMWCNTKWTKTMWEEAGGEVIWDYHLACSRRTPENMWTHSSQRSKPRSCVGFPFCC